MVRKHISRLSDARLLDQPRHMLGLGTRLGLLVSAAVIGAMAVLTGLELAFELRAERRTHEVQLAASLAPLTAQLRNATTPDAAREAAQRFHAAFVASGHARHQLEVLDGDGRTILTTSPHATSGSSAPIVATVPVHSPALGARPAIVRVTDGSDDFRSAQLRRWWGWAVHVVVTALATLVLLYVVIRREVTGPIKRLQDAVRKMERGYWDDLPDPGGAWEVRWLGWRFRALGQELQATVDHLIFAQRRAYAIAPSQAGEASIGRVTTALDDDHEVSPPIDPVDDELELHMQLTELQRADPANVRTRALAQVVWDRSAGRAEGLGLPGLAAELEDAALRVLEPEGYLETARRLADARPRLHALAQTASERLRRALELRGVRLLELHWRVKHPAGVWRKMRLKRLGFDEVHDLVALRIVVPAESDCYHALGAVLDQFTLLAGRFKDYIASPKSNGYRGLHCSVRSAQGDKLEVQIRSVAMHRHAEQGTAAHVDYRAAEGIPAAVIQGGRGHGLHGLLLRWLSGRRRAPHSRGDE